MNSLKPETFSEAIDAIIYFLDAGDKLFEAESKRLGKNYKPGDEIQVDLKRFADRIKGTSLDILLLQIMLEE